MTETELRLILRGSTKEELENKLVDLFGALEDQAHKRKHRRCDPCSEWELKEELMSFHEKRMLHIKSACLFAMIRHEKNTATSSAPRMKLGQF